MASKQDIEDIVVLMKGVTPGWIYDKASRLFFENTNKIEVKKNLPSFKFNIFDNALLEHMVKRPDDVFKNCAWAEDFRKMKGGYIFLLKGTKITGEEGCDIAAHPEKYIVKSVHFEYHVHMLINFSCQIDNNVRKDFTDYLQNVVKNESHGFIPPVIKSAFLYASLYDRRDEGKETTSIKYGLHEFCRLLRESEVTSYPMMATVLKPVSNKPNTSTYASVLMNSPISRTKKNLTDVAKIGQKEKTGGDSHLTSNASAKTFNMDRSIKSRSFETNPGIISFENSSKSEEFHRPEKSKEQAMINTSAGNKLDKKLDDAIENTLRRITQNMEELEKGMQHSSTSRLQMPLKGSIENCKVMIAGVHKSQSTSNPPKDMVSRTQIERQENNSHVSKGKMRTYSLGKHKIDSADKKSEQLSGSSGNPNPLCSKSTSSVTTSGALVHPKNTLSSLLNNCNSLDFASDYGKVDHDKEIESCSLKKSSACESFSKEISKCKTIETASSHLNYQIQRHEKLPVICNVESGREEYGDTSSRSVPMGQHMQMLRRSWAHDHGELEAKSHLQVAHECEDLGMSSVYLKPLKEVNDWCGMKRKYFGVCSNMKEKIIMLLGASGSGKTTLINFVANYFKGVKTADSQLVHVEEVNNNEVRSHTTSITAYTFCSSLDDTPITVIDTPGLNDTSGAEVRDHVLSLKTFLVNALSQNFEIHAIGFVVQAHLVRLTSSERLVMDYVSTLFGQNITEHIITFVTFADSQEIPPVVEAIESYGISCKIFLRFNNSAMSMSKTDEIDDLDRVYWRIGSKSWKKCLNYLKTVPALSVKMMQAVESEVYATHVIEYAQRDLKAELKAFVGFCMQSRCNTKEANQTCEQVWALAAAVHHLTPMQQSNAMDVEMILVKVSEEVCKEYGYNSSICIKQLSLSCTRNLINAGIGLIQTIVPVYLKAKEVYMKLRNIPKDIPKVLFCHQCLDYHELERVKPHVVRRCLNYVGQKVNILSSSLVTYRCLKCQCSGDLHGHEDKDNPQESLFSFSLDPKRLLQHTTNCIYAILENMSISGYQVDKDLYLNHINYVTDNKWKVLINDLLKIV